MKRVNERWTIYKLIHINNSLCIAQQSNDVEEIISVGQTYFLLARRTRRTDVLLFPLWILYRFEHTVDFFKNRAPRISRRTFLYNNGHTWGELQIFRRDSVQVNRHTRAYGIVESIKLYIFDIVFIYALLLPLYNCIYLYMFVRYITA